MALFLSVAKDELLLSGMLLQHPKKGGGVGGWGVYSLKPDVMLLIILTEPDVLDLDVQLAENARIFNFTLMEGVDKNH